MNNKYAVKSLLEIKSIICDLFDNHNLCEKKYEEYLRAIDKAVFEMTDSKTSMEKLYDSFFNQKGCD